jgi:hypothetical protein
MVAQAQVPPSPRGSAVSVTAPVAPAPPQTVRPAPPADESLLLEESRSAAESEIIRTAGAGSASSQVDPLLVLVNRAIDRTSLRYLNANEHTPWQIMHALLAQRRELKLIDGSRKVNALEWLSAGARYKGVHWFEVTRHGARAQPYNGTMYDFEGHINQTLALMAFSNLPLSHEFQVAGGQTITLEQLIHHAKMTVNTREETTWTLWLLTHYLDIDDEWVNEHDQHWSIENLVSVQNRVDVNRAPCGGTHNLFAIAYARNAYLKRYGRLRGTWFEADQKIQRHIELARRLQNVDGSFSTEYFKGPGQSRDFNLRIASSGHNLEWLMMALPHQRLNEPWVRRGLATLATDLIHHASKPADCGPLYHSLDALVLYRDRVAPKPVTPPSVAEAQTPAAPAPSAQPAVPPPAALPPLTGERVADIPRARDTAPQQQVPTSTGVRPAPVIAEAPTAPPTTEPAPTSPSAAAPSLLVPVEPMPLPTGAPVAAAEPTTPLLLQPIPIPQPPAETRRPAGAFPRMTGDAEIVIPRRQSAPPENTYRRAAQRLARAAEEAARSGGPGPGDASRTGELIPPALDGGRPGTRVTRDRQSGPVIR